MKRTTLMLPDDLALAIEREARRRSSSIAKVTREALEERFNPPPGGRAVPFANLGRSDHRHTARDMEDLLDEEWGRAGYAARGDARRASLPGAEATALPSLRAAAGLTYLP